MRILRPISWMAIPLMLLGACGTETSQSSGAAGDQTSASDPSPAAVGESPVDSATSADGELFELDLTISTWPLLPFSVPVMVAMEQGFFEEEGIRINDVISSEGGGTTVRNILTGDIPMGFVSFAAAVQANMAGAPLTVVGPGPQRAPDYFIVAKEDSPLTSLEDAIQQDKSIGFTNPGSGTQNALAVTLLRAGHDPEDVDTRATGGMSTGLTLVREGGIDAMTVIEPIYSMNPEGLKIIHSLDDNVDFYFQGAWVASPQFTEEHPDVVRSFLVARAKAIDWIDENLEAAAELYAEKAELDIEVARETLNRITADGSSTKSYFPNSFNVEAINTLVEGMRAIGLLEEGDVVPYEEFMVQDFLVEDAEEIDLSELENPKPEE